MDNQKIGLFLQKLRKQKGLTQTELANIFEISNKTVSKWECGDTLPEIPLLKALAEFYNVSIDEILKGEVNNNLISKTEIKKELDSYFQEKNEKKSNLFFAISYSFMAIAYLLIYVLGYTIKNNILSCWISVSVYFLSAIILIILLPFVHMSSIQDSLKIKRYSKIHLFFSLFIYGIFASILFYSIPYKLTGSYKIALSIKSFLIFQVILGMIIFSISSVFYLTYTSLKYKKKYDFRQIAFTSFYIFFPIITFISLLFPLYENEHGYIYFFNICRDDLIYLIPLWLINIISGIYFKNKHPNLLIFSYIAYLFSQIIFYLSASSFSVYLALKTDYYYLIFYSSFIFISIIILSEAIQLLLFYFNHLNKKEKK